MWKRCLLAAFAMIGPLLLIASPQAQAAVIGFEGLTDSTSVTNQYAGLGVSFLNATVLQAGVSLNETEFPPASGVNVVFDDGGAITILFAQPVSQVAAFLTYSVAVTLTGFDVLDNPFGFVSSAFAENFASSGNSPNEKLELFFSSGITRITILGSSTGGSFVLDDLTFAGGLMPEPQSLLLAAFALVAAAGSGCFKRARNYPSNR